LITEFISFYNNLEQSVIATSQGRWNELSDTMKMKEPRSLLNLHASLYCSQLYVNYVKELGLGWIGLIFKYPLILHPIPNYREDNYVDKNQERKRWQLGKMLEGFMQKR